MVYFFNNAEITLAIVENQEQVDKLLDIKDQCEHLETIIYDDPRGMRDCESFLVSSEQLRADGRAFNQSNSGHVQGEIDASTLE